MQARCSTQDLAHIGEHETTAYPTVAIPDSIPWSDLMMDHIRHPPLVCGLLTCMACRHIFMPARNHTFTTRHSGWLRPKIPSSWSRKSLITDRYMSASNLRHLFFSLFPLRVSISDSPRYTANRFVAVLQSRNTISGITMVR